MLSRREFLHRAAGLALGGVGSAAAADNAPPGSARPAGQPWFQTRGAVLVVRDMQTYDWPALAREAGLTTLATHIKPSEIAEFVQTDAGQRFLAGCRHHGLEVEHELHALGDLLPRNLFAKDRTMFRMDARGERVRDHNLCVHSAAALAVVAENAARYTRLLRSTTGRYFYWIDDGRPMCRCPRCRAYSDSDQALVFANHILRVIRGVDPRARLAHLAYANTLAPPTQVRPEPGIFLEFAPIERRRDVALSRREAIGRTRGVLHGGLLDALDANLAWFGCDGAQVLEYWLDASLFADWKRERTVGIPWHEEVFRDDLATYARRRIRHISTFAAWMDGDYLHRWGAVPLHAYGAGLRRWLWADGQPEERI